MILWLLFFLAVYNLDTYPAVWFDEGIHLQPPKNLVLYGKYAVRAGETFRLFDSSVSTGPPLLLPVALAFRILGMDLWQARFVTVIYLMLSAAALYELARQLYNPRVGLLAIGLIVISPGLEFVSLGRQVMGEVPAFFFFLLGTLAWIKSTRDRRRWLLIPTGLALGLAMITKDIYTLVLPVCWLLLWGADRWHYRKLGTVYFLLPLLVSLMCVAAWYGYRIAGQGITVFGQEVSEIGASAGRSIFVFAPWRNLTRIKRLVGPNFYLAFGLPALIYNAYAALRGCRSLLKLQRGLLLVTTIVWLIWYLFVSIGWPRYAFPAWIVTALFTARLFLDLFARLARNLRSKTEGKRGGVFPAVNRAGVATLIALGCFFPFYRTSLSEQTVAMLRKTDDPVQHLADYINANVAPDALIESWEWEVDFFTNHRYHHPSISTLDLMARQAFLGQAYSYDMYDFRQHDPDYILDGRFSKWTGLYPPDYLRQDCELVFSAGAYDLYRVRSRH